MPNLQADIGAGLASALGTATGIDTEYVGVSTNGDNDSRGTVMPGTLERLRRFEDTARTRFEYEVVYDLLDRDGPEGAVTAALEAFADSLGEVDGATLFTAIVDNGSNLLANTITADFGAPVVTMAEEAQDGGLDGDADRPRIAATVAVECWHAHPLT